MIFFLLFKEKKKKEEPLLRVQYCPGVLTEEIGEDKKKQQNFRHFKLRISAEED